jgi:hypothetical protein
MSAKNIKFMIIFFTAFLVFLIGYLKYYSVSSADDAINVNIGNVAYQVVQQEQAIAKNNVLFSLVMKTYESDRSLKEIARAATQLQFPFAVGDDAKVKVGTYPKDGKKARTFGWKSYSIGMTFDDNNQLLDLDVADILGKDLNSNLVEAEFEESASE